MPKRVLTLIAVVMLAGCGGQGATATLTPTAVSTPSAAASSSPSSPTLASLDPCVMVPQAEASKLAGAKFGPGKEETTEGGSKQCIYGYQTLNVFIVQVNVAPDAATAKADWATAEAEAQAGLAGFASSQGANLNLQAGPIDLSGADDAAVAAASGSIGNHTLYVSAIYVLSGAVFFMISDLKLDNASTTAAALAAEASTVLTRI